MLIYSEAAYFDGNHCHHVATWEEHKRLARIARQTREAHRHNERRRNGRAMRFN